MVPLSLVCGAIKSSRQNIRFESRGDDNYKLTRGSEGIPLSEGEGRLE